MPFLRRPSARRRVFLNLIAEIEGGLRAAFIRWSKENNENQSGLADRLGISRSVVSRRLTGRVNLTIATIADMIWAMGYCIRIEIFHPKDAAAFRNQALIPIDPALAAIPLGQPLPLRTGPLPNYVAQARAGVAS
jgi:transcriptional regulator with XRE-family HTH domain